MAKIHKDPSKFGSLDKFNNIYRYLNELFAINNPDFSKSVNTIYPIES